MKYKSLFLLLIFSCSLIPFKPVQAKGKITKTIDDAAALMYISDTILLDESELDDSPEAIGMLSLVQKRSADIDTNPLLARIIHAKKMQRNDLDANCKLLTARLRAEGKDCEADKVNSYCQKKRSEINSQIGFYRKMRGDQRKFFTRMWHSMKRNSSNFWHKIGPIGRNILRKVGPEVLQVVVSGGTLNSGVLKTIFKHHARSAVRDRIKQVVFQGVQRLLQGQIEIAQAAGVDICDPEEKSAQSESEKPNEDKETTEEFKLPDTGVWDLTCQHTHEPVTRDYQNITWNIKIYWDSRLFEGVIDADHYIVDENPTQHTTWHEEGGGSVTSDGYLWGDFSKTSTTTITYGDGQPHVNTQGYDLNWIGAISEELDRVCLSRVSASDWFTVDWLRERGRNEMFSNVGYCEGLCIVK